MSKVTNANLPKISVVIPSYNKVNFIKETLNSVLNQKYPDLEIIIQDGGSTDGTLDIIVAFAKKYPDTIIWESGKDRGQTDAINKGLKKSSGKILAYLNADDKYEKNTLHKVGEYFSRNTEALWLAGRGKVINSQGNEIAKWISEYKNFLLILNSYYLLLSVNYFNQPSVFLNKEAYLKHGPFTGTKHGVMEYELWLKLGKIQMPKVMNENLASFRLTKDSLSAVNFESILSEDYNIAAKYTKDPVILFLHWLHNVGRVITLYASRI